MNTLFERGKEFLLNGLATVEPFERVGDQTVMRFDALSFTVTDGAVRVAYMWRGQEVFWMKEPMSTGDTFTLSGLDGRVGVRLE